MIKPALAALALTIAPAHASCYHYSVWRYPYPQPCLVEPRHSPAQAPVILVPSVPIPDIPVAVLPPLTDPEEHDRAVRDHHDEINRLMTLLRAGKLDSDGNEIK